MKKLKDTFRALKYRNFRLFFPGLVVSQTGIWVQNVAISWLVYDMTKSPFSMGFVMCMNFLPAMLITPFAGVLADKFNRQKLLLAVQIAFAVQALLLTVLSFTGLLQIWNIILLGMMLGCIASIDTPLRQSVFVLVVDDKKDLSNAISLNSSCFNLARLIGPSIGGLIIAATNISFCFLINFLCLMPIIQLVRMLHLKDEKSEKIQQATVFEGLKEGLAYSLKTPQIRTMLLYLAFYCFLIMVFPMLIPVYVAEVLNEGADTLGFLLGAAGVGSLTASLLLATKKTTKHLRIIMTGGVLIACLAFVGLGFTDSKHFAVLLMFYIGFGSSSFFTPENVLLQSFIDDDKRGRVLSVNALAFVGTGAISNLFAGSVANYLGITDTFIALGSVMIVVGIFLSIKLAKLNFERGSEKQRDNANV